MNKKAERMDQSGDKQEQFDLGSSEKPLPAEVQAHLGNKLKQVYADMLSEPIPDKFSKLLADLAKSGDSE